MNGKQAIAHLERYGITPNKPKVNAVMKGYRVPKLITCGICGDKMTHNFFHRRRDSYTGRQGVCTSCKEGAVTPLHLSEAQKAWGCTTLQTPESINKAWLEGYKRQLGI